MKTLTQSQQEIISKLTAEFMALNEASEQPKSELDKAIVLIESARIARQNDEAFKKLQSQLLNIRASNLRNVIVERLTPLCSHFNILIHDQRYINEIVLNPPNSPCLIKVSFYVDDNNSKMSGYVELTNPSRTFSFSRIDQIHEMVVNLIASDYYSVDAPKF
mgnify:CR=1 FL=1